MKPEKQVCFFFYLDAWKYCIDQSIDLDQIRRLNWKTWGVGYDS